MSELKPACRQACSEPLKERGATVDARAGIRQAAVAASGIAVLAAAAHDAEASRNCCIFPAVWIRRAASDRARDIRDSGTERSNRAGIAS